MANPEMLLASIPFLRNLAEYSGDNSSYNKLTSLLHLKTDTSSISVLDLEKLVKKVLHDQPSLSLPDPTKSVLDLIYETARKIAINANESHSLEHKVVLSIAIRIKAEQHMIKKIADTPFWSGITSNQTIELIKRFKADFPSDRPTIQLLEQVNLMTPENIHLNSFMYEPILDMSTQHLKKLYTKLDVLS